MREEGKLREGVRERECVWRRGDENEESWVYSKTELGRRRRSEKKNNRTEATRDMYLSF